MRGYSMGLTVKLEAFEGPLDLLLHLLEKNKVSIYDIPIVEITNQYLDCIQGIERQDLNGMSEFLVMASTLVAIKSKMLLPKKVNEDGEEEDPRAELVQQLLEYKLYKYMSLALKDRQIDAGRVFYRKPAIPEEVKEYEAPINLDDLLSDVTLEKLNAVFRSVMLRQENKIDKVRAGFGKIEVEEVSLPEKIAYLEEYAVSHRQFSFRRLLEAQSSKMEVIVSFLAVLELMKTGKITITQKHLFDDIEITSNAAA